MSFFLMKSVKFILTPVVWAPDLLQIVKNSRLLGIYNLLGKQPCFRLWKFKELCDIV